MTEAKAGTESPWEAAKRRAIQDAVVALLTREGMAGLSMDAVAAEAGIAKGTLYRYYTDKRALLEAVFASSVAPLFARIDEVVASGMPADRKLEAYVSRTLAYFDENRDLLRVLLYEHEVSEAKWERYRTPRYRGILDRVAALIACGVAEGTFARVDPQRLAAMVIEATTALARARLEAPERVPLEDDVRFAQDLFLRGLASTPAEPKPARRGKAVPHA